MNRLYNVISSYEVIGFSLVFRRINEGNSIFIIYGTSLVRGNKRLYLTSQLGEVPNVVRNLGKFMEFPAKLLFCDPVRDDREGGAGGKLYVLSGLGGLRGERTIKF